MLVEDIIFMLMIDNHNYRLGKEVKKIEMMKAVVLFNREKLVTLAHDETATIPAVSLIILTAFLSGLHWILERIRDYSIIIQSPPLNIWEIHQLNGLLISALFSSFAVGFQVLVVIIFLNRVNILSAKTANNSLYLRMFGFVQIWNIIGYSIAALALAIDIPYLFYGISPLGVKYGLSRFLSRYYQIFSILSIIAFLFGLSWIINFDFKDRSSKFFPVKKDQAILYFLLLILSFYSLAAYSVSISSAGEWELIWPTTGSGTFFPWPRSSGALQAFSRSTNLFDFFIFVFLIQTGLLVTLMTFGWGFTLIKFRQYQSKR